MGTCLILALVWLAFVIGCKVANNQQSLLPGAPTGVNYPSVEPVSKFLLPAAVVVQPPSLIRTIWWTLKTNQIAYLCTSTNIAGYWHPVNFPDGQLTTNTSLVMDTTTDHARFWKLYTFEKPH